MKEIKTYEDDLPGGGTITNVEEYKERDKWYKNANNKQFAKYRDNFGGISVFESGLFDSCNCDECREMRGEWRKLD